MCLCACSLVRSPVCTGAHTHTHPHRHARVLCVNSLRSRLFICKKTGAINPPADFGRSPARGPGEGSVLLGRGCSWCSKRAALGPSQTLPALGVCPSLGGQGVVMQPEAIWALKKVCGVRRWHPEGPWRSGRGEGSQPASQEYIKPLRKQSVPCLKMQR